MELGVKTALLDPQSRGLPTKLTGLFACIVFIFLFTSIIALTGNLLLADGDTYWHIVVGGQIWQKSSLPQIDELSFTFFGHRWIAKEWLSQLILFLAYDLGSWRAVILVVAATLAASYTLLFTLLSTRMRISVALGLVMIAFTLSVGHFLARPHVFPYPLVVLWVATLVRAVESRASPSLLLVPVMALWANLHAGFTLGLGIAGLLAVEAVFGSSRPARIQTAARWGLFLAAATVAACLTPYGYEPLLVNFKLYGGQSVEHIREWAPLSAKNDPVAELLLVVLVFLALYFGVRIHFWRLVIIALLLHLTFLHVRFAPLFGLILPLLISSSITTQFPFTRLETHVAEDPSFFNVALRLARPSVFFLLGFLTLVVSTFYLTRHDLAPRGTAPAGSVDYIQRNELTGRVYNDFSFSGYLIFRGIKTFIDSRIDQLFTHGFLDRYIRIASGKGGSDFQRVLNEYDISLALVKPDSPEALYLDGQANWTKLYADQFSALYGRSG